MPKITKFDKRTCITLRDDIVAYMAPFLADRGLTLELGNGKFDNGMMRFVGVEFKIPEVAGVNDQANLRIALQMAGIIKPGDTRTVFESSKYTLIDYRPKAYKRPWLAKSKIDGKNYVLEDELARMHFGAKN